MSTRDSTILFSIRSKEYKYLSNDYILPMYINSLEYYHVTGFILSQKFLGYDDKLSDRIRKLSSPIMCRKVSLEGTLTSDVESKWNNNRIIIEIKIGIMIKFLSNTEYAKKLIRTGSKQLINTDGNDEYWGCGKDMKGKNMLGIILMDVRDKINSIVRSQVSTKEQLDKVPSRLLNNNNIIDSNSSSASNTKINTSGTEEDSSSDSDSEN